MKQKFIYMSYIIRFRLRAMGRKRKPHRGVKKRPVIRASSYYRKPRKQKKALSEKLSVIWICVIILLLAMLIASFRAEGSTDNKEFIDTIVITYPDLLFQENTFCPAHMNRYQKIYYNHRWNKI